jgi:nucleotide-binding universal stress UspA family protein
MTCHDDYTDGTVSLPSPARPLYVVGVDDSAAAATALRWAVDKAEATDGEVYAVHVFHARTVLPPTRSPYVPAEVPEETLEQQSALVETRAMVQRALQEGLPTPDRVEIAAVAGDPRHALVELSRGADALVLGASHRGGLVARVLGSTAAACAANASCPVMIVPEGWLAAQAAERALRDTQALLDA